MKLLLVGINSKYIHPAMGIFQIATNSNYELEVLEFTIKDDINEVASIINHASPNLLGLSTYIWNISFIKKLIPLLNSESIILLGGPEASYRPNLLTEFPQIDYIIKNEGETSFNELIESLLGERLISEVSNLYYKEKNTIKYTFDLLPNIKTIKHDLELISDFKNRVVYLEASRGCPFNCSYCLSSLDNRLRYFDIEIVKKEILFCISKSVKTVKFLDRSFNIIQKYMREVLRFIIDNDNLYTSFQFEIVPDLLDDETIKLIKTIRKGLIRFEVGIQSTNSTVTLAVNRKQNIALLKKNIEDIKDNIVIHADLIAGLPYETKESFIKTFNESYSIKADELQLGFLKELQGTAISISKDVHNYIFDQESPYEIISNKYISKDELDEIKLVEEALNVYHNSGNYPKTMDYLFNKLSLDPYQTFLKIIRFVRTNKLPLKQIDEVCKALYDSLSNELGQEYLFIIKQDYLNRNIKPKIWWSRDIDRSERSDIYNLLTTYYPEVILEDLFRYSHLEKHNNQYFLINYKTKRSYFLIK